MQTIGIDALKKNFGQVIASAAKRNEKFKVVSEKGNVIILSQSEYDGMKETLFLLSNPATREALLAAQKNGPSNYADYDPAKAW